jgi:hypothetical protein
MRGTGAFIRIAAGALVTAVILAMPATARADQPTVTPAVNCITANADGTFVAVFGYTNTSSAVVTLTKGGSDNEVTPANLDGQQPESFQPGTIDGAFKVTVAARGTATWTLHGHRQAVASVSSPTCGAQVPMPQDGNGLGVIIATLVAAAFGLFMVVRSPKDPHVAVR